MTPGAARSWRIFTKSRIWHVFQRCPKVQNLPFSSQIIEFHTCLASPENHEFVVFSRISNVGLNLTKTVGLDMTRSVGLSMTPDAAQPWRIFINSRIWQGVAKCRRVSQSVAKCRRVSQGVAGEAVSSSVGLGWPGKAAGGRH